MCAVSVMQCNGHHAHLAPDRFQVQNQVVTVHWSAALLFRVTALQRLLTHCPELSSYGGASLVQHPSSPFASSHPHPGG